MGFLSEGNVCGETALGLVARGSAIVTEVLKLAEHVPWWVEDKSLKRPATEKRQVSEESTYAGEKGVDQRKRFERVLFDFTYLKMPELFEERVNAEEELVEVDHQFQQEFLPVVERFYLVFESIYKYVSNLNQFIQDLSDGFYIQHSVEQLLTDTDGLQLLAEAFYLYSVMLFLMERKIPGHLREKMVIAYVRAKGESSLVNLPQVVKLCRSLSHTRREELFSRFEINKEVLGMVLGKLVSSDVYNLSRAYPNPEHRSTALSTQAAMIVAILYFFPDMLRTKKAGMREICDKFFNDNWVISLYLGCWVDLRDEWREFPAAFAAISNTLEKEHIAELESRFAECTKVSLRRVERFLTKGLLTDKYVLDHSSEILKVLRGANVCMRWVMLHRKSNAAPLTSIQAEDVVELMLKTAQLEYTIKSQVKQLLQEKHSAWDACKIQVVERMGELSAYFTGSMALTRVQRDDTLVNYFARLKTEVESLDHSNPTLAGRRIQKLIRALEEIERYHDIDTSIQIKQFLLESRTLLVQMVRTVGLQESFLSEIDIISDNAYSWEIVLDYKALFHERIKRDPEAVMLLRAYFLKLASVLDIPLLRINQSGLPNAVPVADYFSDKLLHYVRAVLDVIPKSIFDILLSITELQRNKLGMPSSKVETTKLEELAQLEYRHQLASMTHRVGVLSSGVLSMQHTTFGSINVDPKRILEQGIRSELVQRICNAMDENLRFPASVNGTVVETALVKLSAELDAFRRSFEYVQDYIGINGLKIWNVEYSRVIQFYIEIESNAYLKKTKDSKSKFQSKAVPIPELVGESRTFLGRLETALLQATYATVYAPGWSAWFSKDAQAKEAVGSRTMGLLMGAVGAQGMHGLDRLLCFRITQCLKEIMSIYDRLGAVSVEKNNANNEEADVGGDVNPALRQVAQSLSGKVLPARSVFTEALKFIDRNWKHSGVRRLSVLLVTIGQSQLLREKIRSQLEFSAQTQSKVLYDSLLAVNDIFVMGARKSSTGRLPDGSHSLAPFLEGAGLSNMFTKVFISCEPRKHMPELLLLFAWKAMEFLRVDEDFESVVCWDHSPQANSASKAERGLLDGAPLAVGIVTVLGQFSEDARLAFLQLGATLVKALLVEPFTTKSSVGVCQDAFPTTVFLQLFCEFAGISAQVRERALPDILVQGTFE